MTAIKDSEIKYTWMVVEERARVKYTGDWLSKFSRNSRVRSKQEGYLNVNVTDDRLFTNTN